MSISSLTLPTNVLSTPLNTSNGGTSTTDNERNDIRSVDDLISLTKLSREDIQAQIEQADDAQTQTNSDFRSATSSDVEGLARKLFADGEITKGEFILSEFEKFKPQISQQINSLFGNSSITNYQQGERFDLLQALENRASTTENEGDRAEINELIERLNSTNSGGNNALRQDINTQA